MRTESMEVLYKGTELTFYVRKQGPRVIVIPALGKLSETQIFRFLGSLSLNLDSLIPRPDLVEPCSLEVLLQERLPTEGFYRGDRFKKLEDQLVETKGVLQKAVESVLDRGEKLEVLVERSERLQQQAIIFRREAKKMNSCCLW